MTESSSKKSNSEKKPASVDELADKVSDKVWPVVRKEIIEAEERGYLRGLAEANKKSERKTVRGRPA